MYMSIGERIRSRREQKGMTRDELAKAVDMSLTALYMYETGKQVPSTVPIVKIAKALDVSVDYLVGLEKIVLDVIPFLDINSELNPLNEEGKVGLMPKVFEADFATEVPDNAMYPAFSKGEVIFVRITELKDANGRVVLIKSKGKPTLRRLSLESGKVILKPDNPSEEPQTIDMLSFKTGEFELVGVVEGRVERT